jgi:hypothetical protein
VFDSAGVVGHPEKLGLELFIFIQPSKEFAPPPVKLTGTVCAID